MNNIIVISYPRSGTHLLIDLIRNNFSDFYNPYISFVGIKNRPSNKQLALVERISKTHRIFKAHYFPKKLFSKDFRKNKIINYILSNSHLIYVYRDGKDVLVSQYYRRLTEHNTSPKISFSSFIRTKNSFQGIEETPAYLWALFNQKWLDYDNRLLVINFSELIEEPKSVVARIKTFINKTPNVIFKDVRLTTNESNEKLPFRFGNGIVNPEKISHTSIYFRKGIIGDYKNHFSKSDLNFYKNDIERIFKKKKKMMMKTLPNNV